ncbi:cyclin G [Anopheles merus]|uniref:cyclin G n=1 Tax=Anopheles merus TaxID=30066 RepID=UPI001BE4153B|nr:cyclin G [Anopheles merus]XP_041763942.1 cyclin G [Anopheles merus]XP_041763943.1 cyclin G [Anopheles merus]
MSVPVSCYSVDSMNNIDQQPIGIGGHGLPTSSSTARMMMMRMEEDDDHRPMMRMSPATNVHAHDQTMHHDQRMLSEEGRLGTPDAADGVLLASHDCRHGGHNTSATGSGSMHSSGASGSESASYHYPPHHHHQHHRHRPMMMDTVDDDGTACANHDDGQDLADAAGAAAAAKCTSAQKHTTTTTTNNGSSSSSSSSPSSAPSSPMAAAGGAAAAAAAAAAAGTAAMSFEEMMAKLSELLALEPKYQPNLYLPQQSVNGEITIGTRDGAAHVLRCLKVWYELPNDVLFAAINLVDRFLTKMKVRPKHMACISVSSFHLAVQQLSLPIIDTEDLIAISQCRCTSRDLVRMADIVANKLGVQMNLAPVTALSFIRLFYYIFEKAANALGLSEIFKSAISLADLEMRLEILACDASCASIRPSELALVMIFTQMDVYVSANKDNGLVHQQIHDLVDYAIQLQKFCRIPDSSFLYSHSIVTKILSLYNGQHKIPYKQRLVWKLSSRTMRVLRPTDKLTSYLPTIAEHHHTHGHMSNSNLRFRTGSVSSEDDGEDWPTSPIVAVCEQFVDE